MVALIAFVAGLPLQRLFNRFVTSSHRRWIATHRRTLMLIVGGLGLLVLLVWSPLTGRVVLVDLLVVAALLGVIATLGLQPADAVAEQLDADDQQQDGHDHGVVGGHP
jgi:hypothetical protein